MQGSGNRFVAVFARKSGSLFLGQNFVARESIALGVVRSNTVWVSDGFERLVTVVTLVVNEVANILGGEITGQTHLLILNFGCGQLVIVVQSSVVKELFVECGLEEKLEVAHKASMIAVFVFAEYGQKSVVALLAHRVLLFLFAEVEVELDKREQSQTPQAGRNTSLKCY